MRKSSLHHSCFLVVHPVLWQRGDVRVVASEECFESGLCRLTGRRGCESEDCAGISFCVVSPRIELVHLAVLLPGGTTGIEARFLALEPGFHPSIGRLDNDAVVVDAVLDPVELAL